jgi:cobalt-zinc-cadmium efflux system protein
MAHDHHTHHHHQAPANLNAAFIIGIVLNLLFVIVQVIVGLSIHSLSLLSDAGHNFADVGALAISMLAFRLLRVPSSRKYTYGYRKTSVLTALFNAMVLLVSIGAILYEAAHRFFNPEPLPGQTIAIVAGIGIVINAASALLFFRDRKKDINIKSAYLHLMSDAVVSLGLVIGGVIIYYTGWYWFDTLMSIIVAIVILISTWQLLRDSLRLSLDGVPPHVDLEGIRTMAMAVPGVKNFYHLHVWAISTSETALTAHIVVSPDTSYEQEQQIKAELKHQLLHKDIHHVTIETERASSGGGEQVFPNEDAPF